MPGQLIISFDCEGKWGMADHLGPLEHRFITDRALARTYDKLVEMLGRHEMPATFAFVMAFVLDKSEQAEFSELLGPSEDDDAWMTHVVRERAAFPEGWHVPSSLTSVMEGGMHEVACHGFSHRSLGDGELSAAGMERELQAARSVAARKDIELETMIFPRNRVGHLSALRAFGYRGYRTRKRSGGRLPAPVANLVEEFNLFTPAEPVVPANRDQLVAIPHGHFFNWRQGNRRAIPPWVTVWRWKAMLDRAAHSGQVAHLWLHPHNFLTGPGTWQPFEEVLVHAGMLRDAGKLSVVTQADYCSMIEGQAAREESAR